MNPIFYYCYDMHHLVFYIPSKTNIFPIKTKNLVLKKFIPWKDYFKECYSLSNILGFLRYTIAFLFNISAIYYIIKTSSAYIE